MSLIIFCRKMGYLQESLQLLLLCMIKAVGITIRGVRRLSAATNIMSADTKIRMHFVQSG